MAAEVPKQNETMGRVIWLRPRSGPPTRPAGIPTGAPVRPLPGRPSPVGSLDRFERDGEQDDYRHRMMTNAAALVICAVLVISGVWIANTMAQIRKDQDCVLSGRRSCTAIDVPIRAR